MINSRFVTAVIVSHLENVMTNTPRVIIDIFLSDQ